MKLHAAFIKILNQPDFVALLSISGIIPIGSSPEELSAYMFKENIKWAKLIKSAGIKIE
jgi:tripartite-type tricarboxylate transporter receptor subunit TctC